MGHQEYISRINNIYNAIADLNMQKELLTNDYYKSILEYNGYKIGDTITDQYNNKHIIEGVVDYLGKYYIKTNNSILTHMRLITKK